MAEAIAIGMKGATAAEKEKKARFACHLSRRGEGGKVCEPA
jgi:hypothetical protein